MLGARGTSVRVYECVCGSVAACDVLLVAASSSITGWRGRKGGQVGRSNEAFEIVACFPYLKQTYPLLITPRQMPAKHTHRHTYRHTHTHTDRQTLINNTQIPNEFQLIPAMCAQQLQFIFVDFSCATITTKTTIALRAATTAALQQLQQFIAQRLQLQLGAKTHKFINFYHLSVCVRVCV